MFKKPHFLHTRGYRLKATHWSLMLRLITEVGREKGQGNKGPGRGCPDRVLGRKGRFWVRGRERLQV